jgi:two-component system sensor histidine kinase RegB
MQELRMSDQQASNRLRLNTLIRLRWLAIIGQGAAVLIVAYGLDFPLSVSLCFLLIAAAAWLNVVLALRFPAAHRLKPFAALGILMFDAAQLAGLLYLTGGLTNPFSVLMTVPVVISATSLSIRLTGVLGGFVVIMATLLMFYHLPLPWYPGTELDMPFVYVAGMWMAVVSSIAFTGVYAWRVAEEARLLANALNATEMVLQREQHLSAIDGLAAAAAHELGTPLATIALVAKEMERALGKDARYKDDVKLLRSQSDRCREILKRLTSLSSESDTPLMRLPLTSMIEEVIAPHRDFGIAITLEPRQQSGPEPVGQRNPGVMYGLGNLVENAVDFAKSNVTLRWRSNDQIVGLEIIDDGPGFLPDIIDRIGEPYMSTRQGTEPGGGLGLGLFIAKTLLERSGASIQFRNSQERGQGATVEIIWPRAAFVAPPVLAETAVG